MISLALQSSKFQLSESDCSSVSELIDCVFYFRSSVFCAEDLNMFVNVVVSISLVWKLVLCNKMEFLLFFCFSGSQYLKHYRTDTYRVGQKPTLFIAVIFYSQFSSSWFMYTIGNLQLDDV